MADNIWVIGNGESRRNIDLNNLTGVTIGCNAVHRNYICDKIVAVDKRMVKEILLNPCYKDIIVYTRIDWINHFKHQNNVQVCPDLPFTGTNRWDNPWHWNSGPYAVLVACLENPKIVNLIGFDLYGSNNKVNNLYKDTDNYDKSDRSAINNSHWIYQLGKLFSHFQEIKFIQWQREDWPVPSDWTHLKNLTIKSFDEQ
jgi:hypothetical protein